MAGHLGARKPNRAVYRPRTHTHAYFAISQAEASQGLVIILPNKPGATGNYPVADPPGPDITIKNTSWQVLIQYLEP